LCFPPTVSASPTSPFPTQWLPRVGSPPFARYYEDAKTSAAHPVSLRIPSGHGYFPASLFLRSLLGPGSRARCAGALVYRFRPLAPVGSRGRSQSDLSSSQGTRSCLCPALRPRSDLRAKPVAALRCCPRGFDDEGSNVDLYFEAQSHGFSTRSIRFVPTSLPTTQCSLPVGGQPLPGGVLTHWVPVRCFRVGFPFTYSSSLSGFS
jgi:hypothetical protein